MDNRLLARIYLPEDPETVALVLTAYDEAYYDVEVRAQPLVGTEGVLEIYKTYPDDDDGEDE